MNNCLVTKLKGTVDNNSLSILGEVKIPVINGVISSFGLMKQSDDQIIKGINGVLINGSESVTLHAGWTENLVISGVPNDSIGYISIPDKYKVIGIDSENVVVEDNLDDLITNLSEILSN